jgi:DNA-binding transcriptional LysR family regulator
MDLNLRNVRAFLAVAELGSFTRAATSLHVSQPALTVQIRNLEQALKVGPARSTWASRAATSRWTSWKSSVEARTGSASSSRPIMRSPASAGSRSPTSPRRRSCSPIGDERPSGRGRRVRAPRAPPRIACQTTYLMTAVAMVPGLGITILPGSARERYAFAGLFSKPIDDPSFIRPVAWVKKRGRSLSPACESFARTCFAAMKKGFNLEP